jgi:putative membrane protein
VLSGLLLWLPIISPLPELRHPSVPVKCVYLFLASGALPMMPGGILTFAEFPLYATYELAPRVWGIDATTDQQGAGILMKIGNLPVVWTVIFVMFGRWALRERDANVVPTKVGAPS